MKKIPKIRIFDDLILKLFFLGDMGCGEKFIIHIFPKNFSGEFGFLKILSFFSKACLRWNLTPKLLRRTNSLLINDYIDRFKG